MRPFKNPQLKVKLKDLAPVVLLLLSCLLLFLVIMPQFRRVRELNEQRKAIQLKRDELAQRVNLIRSYTVSLNLLTADQTLLTRALPAKEEIPTLMGQVQQIAREAGVTLGTLNYSGRVVGAGDAVGKVTVQAGINGNFKTITRFLELLEQSSRLLDTMSLNLSGQGVGLSLSMPLDAYYYPAEEVTEPNVVITLNTSSPEYITTLAKVKALKYYDIPVDTGRGIGKDDPFSAVGTTPKVEEVPKPSPQQEQPPTDATNQSTDQVPLPPATSPTQPSGLVPVPPSPVAQ